MAGASGDAPTAPTAPIPRVNDCDNCSEPDPELLDFACGDDSDSDGEEARYAAIRDRERRAARPWHAQRGSVPASSLSGKPQTFELIEEVKVAFCDFPFPPHGGEIVATGGVAWDASLVLAKFLAHDDATRTAMPRCRVVELGAGLAIPSLACHALGAAEVVATDVDERLPLIRSNIRLNVGSEGGAVDGAGKRRPTITAAPLRWGDAAAAEAVGTAQLVLCSDVLFSDEAIDPLVSAIDAVAAPNATVLSCCEHRFEGATRFYAALSSRRFDVAPVPLSQQHPVYRHESIHLHRAKRRP